MAIVSVMQRGSFMFGEKRFPAFADGYHDRTQLSAYRCVRVGDQLLILRLVLSGPRHIQDRLRSGRLSHLVKEPYILVHARRVLYRKRALLLQYNVVIPLGRDLILCVALVPMHAKRRTTGADQLMFKFPAMRRGKLRDHTGQIIARRKAVADEEDIEVGWGVESLRFHLTDLRWERSMDAECARRCPRQFLNAEVAEYAEEII